MPLDLSLEDLLSKKVKFVSLPVRSHYPTVAETPFDVFCPSMKGALQNCICDICKKAFPSKAQMLEHRRKLHKFKRIGRVLVSELLTLESEQQLKDVEFIADHNLSSKEFKVVFKDGSTDWVTILDQKNKLVQKYFERKRIIVEIETFEAADGNWMNMLWEPMDANKDAQ